MPDDLSQRKLFKFLKDHFVSGEPFTKDDVSRVTGWNASTLRTYWSKQINPLIAEETHGTFTVSESFRKYGEWKRFQRSVVSQVRRPSGNYVSCANDSVIIFEFFMPLANEEHLRASLDSVFYEESIVSRLKRIRIEELKDHFLANSNEESDQSYFKRLTAWISDTFGGYSIFHVNGRFKIGDLKTYQEAGAAQLGGERYLVDETTAVVRFIFPCGQETSMEPPLTETQLGSLISAPEAVRSEEEATKIRWFFGVLFVRSILQAVSGEDEIWMVESGMRSRLHRWRAAADGQEE